MLLTVEVKRRALIRAMKLNELRSLVSETERSWEERRLLAKKAQEIIENHDLNDKNLSIWFYNNGKRVAFNHIKEQIYDKLNEFKQIEGIYYRLYYKVNGDKRYSDFSLNNERGQTLIHNFESRKKAEKNYKRMIKMKYNF